ncbi:hypothetical protein C8J57DRAFT_1423604 [Mycena rebaudengoi]|nr:hypothetical protein C8J57DRAFT_1423604 [Mycena rebaudengoi]
MSSTMAEEVPPTLPFELERRVFETAAFSRPVSVPAMMLVAWRVKLWVEPLLYRTLVFTESNRLLDSLPVLTQEMFKRIVRTKPILLRDAVRNVMIRYEGYVYEADVADIVHACLGIENLNFEINPSTDLGMGEYGLDESYITGIQTLPLRRMHCDLLQLFDWAIGQPSRLSLFTHLTHLDLFYWFNQANSTAEARTRLGDLPQLTHLSVPSHTSNSGTPILAHLLDVCKSLRALIVLAAPLTPPTDEIAFLAENDVRFVTVWPHDRIADWQRGALTGIDYWTRADEHIARRLSGEVDRRMFHLAGEF